MVTDNNRAEPGACMHQPHDPARHAARRRRRGAHRQARHASALGEGFGRFAAVTALALVPGAGLIAAGRRRLGGLLLGLTVAAVLAAGALALWGDATGRALRVAVQPRTLLISIAALVAIALLWCATIVVTAWTVRPVRPSLAQRVLGVSLVAALCTVVAAPSSVGVRYALIQRDLVSSVFTGADDDSAEIPVKGAATPQAGSDPWVGVPRVNVLLLGSDAGANRTGVRTDSMIVASIDTATGNTVLLGLPRSLQNVPFPKSNPLRQVWPNGFNCGDQCLLNGVWEQAATARRDLFEGVPNPGLMTTRGVIGEVLGLRIDSYVTIDLRGFQSLVDAMGGVQVDVPRRIPIGGGTNLSTGQSMPITGWIEAGPQRLTGYQALWFARSREGTTDYDRMGRQRCLVTALIDQANPAQLLAKYPRVASVAKRNIQTDIRQRDLPAWVVLVQRIQQGKITSLPFTNEVISTVNPDFDQIRALVQRAIKPRPAVSASATTSSTPGATPRPTASAKPTPKPTSADVRQAQEASAVC